MDWLSSAVEKLHTRKMSEAVHREYNAKHVHLALSRRDARIALDELGENPTSCFNSEAEGSDVHQQITLGALLA